MYADLHLHSTFSDGTDTPRELIELAAARGIRVIAIADHDSVRGAAEALKHLPHIAVSLIPAIEISTVCNRRLLHMLGYYIDIACPALGKFIARISAEKTENTRINFERARELGVVAYDWERVLKLHPDQPRLSGVHVVAAMERDGAAAEGMGLRDLFRRFFLPTGAEFIETETTTAYDAIDIIRAVGGIPVIAHPKSIQDDEVVLALIDAGVKGLEIYHPSHAPEERAKYRRMAVARGLFVTGGSDWHGGNSSPDTPRIGCTGLDSGDYPILRYGRE